MTAEILWEIEPLLERVTNLETDLLTYEGIPGMVYDYPEGMQTMEKN